MASLADSLVSSSSRTLPIRARPDLEAKRQRYQGRVYWVVKDPVALQYFRFEEEEFSLLGMLDGESSLDEIIAQYEAVFPTQPIRSEELQQFIGTLHRSGLVIADAPGQGEQLNKRRGERKRKELIGKFTNILSMRFKGIDPDRLLTWMLTLGPIRWFFSTPALVCCSLLMLAAATLVLVEFDVFQSKLPSFQTFFAAQNWVLLASILGVTKVLHEFGHGLSCKRLGGECHEMGVMLLVLTPCLYCNVSDSWMLPNRWHRAAIGAAGMYVECVIAAICTFVWWFTEPGWLNYVCLNIMFVSSVSTVLFNANPLLKYDGYYILSDLMEVPNLRQKASTILSRKLGKWCLGLEEQDDPFLPRRNQWLFALYTVAAALYRWVVVLSICYFLNQVFEPYGLKPLGQLISLMALWGLLGQPLWQLYKHFKVPGRLSKVKRVPFLVSCAVVAAAIAAVIFVPLPSSVHCAAVIEPAGATNVYVETAGVLREVFVKHGDRVAKGDPLARLESPEIDLAITRLEGECSGYEAEIRALEDMTFEDRSAASQIAPIRKSLASARDQLAKQRADAERMTLRAPSDGHVLPATYVTPRAVDDKELVAWHGTPLDEKNLGATLEPGDRLCQVGDPERFEARLAVHQDDIDLVAEGQRVRLMLNQSTHLTYVGKIDRISRDEMPTTPPRLSSLTQGPIPTETDQSGAPRPLSPHYDAIVPLVTRDALPDAAKQAHDLLRLGVVGEAKVAIAPRTLWKRAWRYLTKTVNFDL
ncbi:MAG: HlyD family efflux transporter periplasmic adaptor subunit [Lacipirellulaceae bacterium]